MDTSAAIIKMLEKAGLVTDVKWPSAERVARKRAKPVPAAASPSS
ncbi:unannotated protein [freshwater metagenome]|uniref:Unannotated protein n=1 Tax=freshwater metagenome TaxID=449393 RepID=A0A6J6SUR8_9ZZZZ